MARLMARNGLSEEQARQRVQSQAGNEERREVARRVFVNNEESGGVEEEVEEAMRGLLLP